MTYCCVPATMERGDDAHVSRWLLLPQGWRRAGTLTLIFGLLAASAGVASLYANNPLTLPAQDPRQIGAYVPDNWILVMARISLGRMYALHGAALAVGTLMISSVLARPLARGAFRLLVPMEHLSGVALLWTADGLPELPALHHPLARRNVSSAHVTGFYVA